MKQTSFIAILLTILMLLLVMIAAVVFLVQRNQELTQMVNIQSSDQETMVEMSEDMATDLAVRQAALESAEATREALAGQITVDQERIQELKEGLSQTESSLSQAESEIQDLAIQLFIFSPKDGAVVPPLEPVELFVAARSDAGIEPIEITIDGAILVRYPSEGQPTSTIRTEWAPPEEGEYLIEAVARDRDGRLSEPESVTIRAAFSTPADRTSAYLKLTENEVITLRFPETLETVVQPEVAEVSPDDLHQLLLTGRGMEESPFSDDDVLVLQALDLLPADTDVDDLANPAYDGTTLAYYDPDDEQITFYEPGDQPETFGRWVHIHDFTHQMLNETFQLDALEISSLDQDARAAVRALLEGEATYLQYLYTEGDYLEAEQQSEIFEGLSAAASNTMDDLPPYLQDDFDFAYTDGLLFVQSLHEQDGFSALNEAWLKLPESTEQILHPDRYLAGDRPIPVTIDPLGENFENWRLVGEDVLGEYQLRQHLQALGLAASQIDQAATGWGGGRYVVYQDENTGDLILQMRLAWDTPEDNSEFAATYGTLLSQRYDGQGMALPGGDLCWEGEDATCLLTPAGDILIVRGPNLETVNAIIANQ
jgi:hypothetical protein